VPALACPEDAVRFVSLRLPTGTGSAGTSLWTRLYPRRSFCRCIIGAGDTRPSISCSKPAGTGNFSGRTVEAVQQDVQAAVLLANLESVLSEPLRPPEPASTPAPNPQVNRSNSYHALKDQVLDLLYRTFRGTVITKLLRLFKGSP